MTENTPKEQRGQRVPWRKLTGILIILVIGIWVGRATSPEGTNAEGGQQLLSGRGSSQATEVDFKKFWDVWELVEEKHVMQPPDYEQMLDGAIAGMLRGIGDPYTAYLPAQTAEQFSEDLGGTFQGIGAEIGFVDGILAIIAPLEDTPADRAGLQASDLILEIDGESTDGLSLTEAVARIRGKGGTEVVLGIVRKGEQEIRDIAITRDVIDIQATKITIEKTEGEPTVAVIQVLTFDKETAKETRERIQEATDAGAQGIVIDVRNNPGGLLTSAIEVADLFLPKDTLVVKEVFRNGKENRFETRRKQETDLPIVVLTNEGSASASEILAGALKDEGGAVLVGKKTFGKGSVQELQQLKDGSSVRITVATWQTPAGTHLDGEGISPDVEVDREIPEESEEGEELPDNQREKAIEVVRERL